MPGINLEDRNLKHVAPLTYWISWGYVYTNIFLGIAFINIPRQQMPYIIVSRTLTPTFWGLIFIILGTMGAISLIAGNWHFIRRVLMTGLVLKSLWLYALIFGFKISGLGALVLFSFIAYIQFLTVIYFPER
jgi:hypothetical protein